uniref:hypothetical protein n=1 Tax=Altererythrobacter segetis TaxID=1104773 RepID=UPI00140918B4|nr:hypothetical protein [Altererythrobacter segetis]
MPLSNVEMADRLNRRRARMLPVLAVFVLIQQAAFFNSGDRLRTVDLVRNSGWIMLATVILAGLVTGGFWFRSREVRELMNDEVTLANRASALTWGFTMAIAAAIALFALESFAPGGATTREVIHIIASAGLVTALLRFGFVERRALG